LEWATRRRSGCAEDARAHLRGERLDLLAERAVRRERRARLAQRRERRPERGREPVSEAATLGRLRRDD
jgi:hypothetical protein